MRTTSLRLTNVYGPRQHLDRDGLGFLPVFVRRALAGERHRAVRRRLAARDCLHVDDVVDALLLAATTAGVGGEMFNLGHPDALVARRDRPPDRRGGRHGRGRIECAPVARRARAHRHRQLPGRLREGQATVLGWAPRISFADGIASTIGWYSGPRVVPVVDLTRRLGRLERPSSTSVRPRAAVGHACCSAPSSTPSSTKPARTGSAAGRRRRRGQRGGARSQLALAALGDRAGRRGHRPRVHRGADRVGGVRGRARHRFRSTSTRTTALIDLDRALDAVTDPHAGDRRRPPLRPARRPVAPLPMLGLPVVEDAAQAHGALVEPSPARGRATRSTRRRTSAASATAARSSPPTPSSPPPSGACGCTA